MYNSQDKTLGEKYRKVNLPSLSNVECQLSGRMFCLSNGDTKSSVPHTPANLFRRQIKDRFGLGSVVLATIIELPNQFIDLGTIYFRVPTLYFVVNL